MNKNYVIGANKAIVTEKENLEMIDYTDNFEEVLEQENIIETIKNKIEQNKNNGKKLNERLRIKRTENAVDIALLAVAIIVLFGSRLLLKDILTNSLFVNVFVSKLISQVVGVFTIAFITGKIIGEIKVQRELKKTIKGIEKELEFLNEKLPEEKQKLEDLKKLSKPIETTQKIEYKSVDLSNIYNLEQELKELKIKKRIRERK